MRITFKTVTNKLFTIDADESETVANLKSKIQESQSFAADLQKIIYSGKILKDDATVGGLNIKEKDFLVVMVSKPKATPAAAPAGASAPAPATATPPAESSSATAAAPAASTSAPAPTAPAAESPAPAAPIADAPAAPAAESAAPATEAPADVPFGSAFLTGAALSSAIDNLVDMGFPRDQVIRAMRASFNNPDRAAEYLVTGSIPETEDPAPAPTSPATTTSPLAAPAAATRSPPAASPAAGRPAGGSADNLFAAAQAAMDRDRGEPTGAGGAAGGRIPSLEEIANSPQMARIREAVQNDPSLIQPLLEQVAATNPDLANLIAQNPRTLYNLLGMEIPDGEFEGGGGPQVMQVNLTEEEVAAVERLEQLGFPRQMVLQAFLLCDKNEELAANFLFESTEEDENMQ